MSADLTTTYLGLTLRNPVVASPGPVTGDPDQWRRLEDAGVGAIVLPSLFEEEIESRVVVGVGPARPRPGRRRPRPRTSCPSSRTTRSARTGSWTW